MRLMTSALLGHDETARYGTPVKRTVILWGVSGLFCFKNAWRQGFLSCRTVIHGSLLQGDIQAAKNEVWAQKLEARRALTKVNDYVSL